MELSYNTCRLMLEVAEFTNAMINAGIIVYMIRI